MYNPTSPLPGASATGLTSPTYTLSDDSAPGNGVQKYVSALGGTQTGVQAHSVSAPFTLTVFKPVSLKQLPLPNPTTGRLASIPTNKYTVVTRKAVLPLADHPHATMIVRTEIVVPTGADVADPLSLKAGLSAHIGLLVDQSANIGDSLLIGTF